MICVYTHKPCPYVGIGSGCRASGCPELDYDEPEMEQYYDELMSKRQRIVKLKSFVERSTNLIEAEKTFREHLESENKMLINKACRWLAENVFKYTSTNGGIFLKALLDDFSQAMEDKK